ncbi:hypothetical protein Gohar_010826, partial [Gossypium harknessii]|nr:hypothetical protein [Gossypium harknessii]
MFKGDSCQCATDNMSQATCSLTPVMYPYGILQVAKVLDSLSNRGVHNS